MHLSDLLPRIARSRRRTRRRPSTTVLPRLPPEIWMLIMRIAASDSRYSVAGPNGHLGSLVSFLDTSHSQSDLLQRLRAYRSSLRSKVTFSMVSREWNAIALEMLYEFIWISRASQAKALASTISRNGPLGEAMRRLHIETPTLERCDPDDLRAIIEHAPNLAAYSDYRSVRRIPHTLSQDHLLSTLARPGNNLKRLSWTNYDYDRRDQSGCLSFFLRLSPALGKAASELDYLELCLCTTDLTASTFSSLFDNSVLSVTTTTTTTTSSSYAVPSLPEPINLPALRTLKLTLDNTTFSILSFWEMPVLQHLSVVSADFLYTGKGFARFFQVHGPKITQLELGHSTGAIEEHYLTTPPHHRHRSPCHLADWCPNLREFICSADAEWNWESPDWIPPHVLLPSHPNVELIAIRDMDKRLYDDFEFYRVRHSVMPSDAWSQYPFFRLAEQIQSLLRKEAFPKLKTIRDLSWESAMMRSAEGTFRKRHPHSNLWGRLVSAQAPEDFGFGRWLTVFWTNVQARCAERDVSLQDWNGDILV